MSDADLYPSCACSYKKLGKVLGSGEFGTVYKACTENDCERLVVKTTDVSQDTNLSSYVREVYYLRALESSGLVPHLLDARIVGKTGSLVMSQCRPFLDVLSERTKAEHKIEDRVVLKYRELARLRRVVQGVANFGIIHGDLQLSQFLYRCTQDSYEEDEDQIYLSDFGIAFDTRLFRPTMAEWMKRPASTSGGYSCRRFDFQKLMADTQMRRSFMVWLLEQHLLDVALIEHPDGTLRKPGKLQIRRTHRDLFQSWCVDYRQSDSKMTLGEEDEEDRLESEQSEEEFYE